MAHRSPTLLCCLQFPLCLSLLSPACCAERIEHQWTYSQIALPPSPPRPPRLPVLFTAASHPFFFLFSACYVSCIDVTSPDATPAGFLFRRQRWRRLL